MNENWKEGNQVQEKEKLTFIDYKERKIEKKYHLASLHFISFNFILPEYGHPDSVQWYTDIVEEVHAAAKTCRIQSTE